jgi:hypothetical protein
MKLLVFAVKESWVPHIPEDRLQHEFIGSHSFHSPQLLFPITTPYVLTEVICPHVDVYTLALEHSIDVYVE